MAAPARCSRASVARLTSSTIHIPQHTASVCQAAAYLHCSSQSFIPYTEQRLSRPLHQRRSLHRYTPLAFAKPPKSRDRGPQSKEETQTDFAKLNVLGNSTAPTTGIDACTNDGFALNSGVKVSGCGVMLAGGEVFRWRPWAAKGDGQGSRRRLTNSKGQWEVDKVAWGVLDLLWPKPDLLILGTGPSIIPISPATRKDINDLGIRIEIQDTRNASAQFNLLATERGVQQVAAALVPMGWRDPK